MTLLDRIGARWKPAPSDPALMRWLQSLTSFSYNGHLFPITQTGVVGKGESIANSYLGYASGLLQSSAVVFAVEAYRLKVFSQIRYQFQSINRGRPGDLFGTTDLGILERPWPNATTADLNSRMLLMADLGGNGYVWRDPNSDRLRVLRPDRVSIISSPSDPADPESQVIGYSYMKPGTNQARFFPVDEIAHFAPLPDPLAEWRGMSWMTPVVRHALGHMAATEHKLKFFELGATPNMIVKVDPTVTVDAFKAFRDMFNQENAGVANAYKTLFLGGGADATVVGSNFEQMSFKSTQGVDETLIAAAGGVPPSIVGLSEGLQGSSLNAGNFEAARRLFASTTIQDLASQAAASLETIVSPPSGPNRLWFDTRDIPFFRADEGDEAKVRQMDAITLRTLVDAGFNADAGVRYLISGDLAALVGAHSGLFSVQLQPPGTQTPEPEA